MAEEVFRIKQHDLEPPLIMDISGSSGDLTTVASWRMIAKRGTTTVFIDTAPTVTVGTPTTSASVKHTWVAGETDVAGTHSVETEATWPGGRKQTFPPEGYKTFEIVPDLS